jgi:hypothetical protein
LPVVRVRVGPAQRARIRGGAPAAGGSTGEGGACQVGAVPLASGTVLARTAAAASP